MLGLAMEATQLLVEAMEIQPGIMPKFLPVEAERLIITFSLISLNTSGKGQHDESAPTYNWAS